MSESVAGQRTPTNVGGDDFVDETKRDSLPHLLEPGRIDPRKVSGCARSSADADTSAQPGSIRLHQPFSGRELQGSNAFRCLSINLEWKKSWFPEMAPRQTPSLVGFQYRPTILRAGCTRRLRLHRQRSP